MTPPAGDRGSATAWMLTGCALVLSLGTSLLAVGAAVADRHRASAAADLAALAGAQEAIAGSSRPCAAAAAVAQANSGRLVQCTVTGTTVAVVVEISTGSPLLSALPPARARARAGEGAAP